MCLWSKVNDTERREKQSQCNSWSSNIGIIHRFYTSNGQSSRHKEASEMKSSANTLARCSQFTPELYNQTPKYKFDCMPESVKHEKRMKMDKHVTVAHTICIMLGMVLLCISWILLLPNGGFEREKNRQLHAKPNNWSICILHCYRCFDFPELKMSFLKLANDTDLLSVPLSQFFSTQILERKKLPSWKLWCASTKWFLRKINPDHGCFQTR